MTDKLRLSADSTGGVNFLDTTKWAVIELDDPTPNISRQTRAGCGGTGTQVTKRSLESWTIPMVVRCLGSDGNTRFTNRNTLISELEAAVATETRDINNTNYDGRVRYLTRTVDNQSPGDVWQVMDYNINPTNKRNDNKHVTLNVSLICYPGQKLPSAEDLAGVTVTSLLGGIGRAVLDSSGFPAYVGTL